MLARTANKTTFCLLNTNKYKWEQVFGKVKKPNVCARDGAACLSSFFVSRLQEHQGSANKKERVATARPGAQKI